MIEFLKKEHIYLVDGIITPSVSEILKYKFPNKYKGIDTKILKDKAEFGTRVHKGVEEIGKKNMSIDEALPFIETFGFYEKLCLMEYLKLKARYLIEEEEQEIIVNYKNDFCGTLDMSGYVLGKESLLDIKTTAELDKEYLSWQLSLYELASGKKYKDLYCIWLPKKDIGRLEKINRVPKKELLLFLKKYKEEKENE